jgi:hypothetical protein
MAGRMDGANGKKWQGKKGWKKWRGKKGWK